MFNLTAIGRLTADPELHTTPTGKSVLNFSIATDRYRGKDNDKATDYIDITVWGKMAEVHAANLAKGSLIAVNGELIQRSWEQDGGRRTKHECNAATVEYLAKAKNSAPAEEANTEEEPF